MTTQVAVANLDGIAVASDTLVTFGKKTLDGARKIYELGDTHKVLMMHSGSARISGTTQYLHFVEWAKTLGEPFPKLTDYIDSYLAWAALPHAVISDEGKRQNIEFVLNDHYGWMRENRMYPRLAAPTVDGNERSLEEDIEITSKVIAEGRAHLEGLADFDGLTEKVAQQLLKEFEIDLDSKINGHFKGYPISDQGRADLIAQAPLVLLKRQEMDTDSSIAFVGYGADEPYPAVVRMRLRGMLGGHVQAIVEDGLVITAEINSSVSFFAQYGAMDALLSGAHEAVLRTVWNGIGETLESRFPDLPEEDIREIIDAVNTRVRRHSRENFVEPFMSTISAMGIGKLADLADSLIRLQLTSAHGDYDRATIGGTIEVAIIDRQHGVRWVSKIKEDVLSEH